MPKDEMVSVIIPLYNAAPYIEETIRSILAQTFTDFKIYVVDDFSTDESPQIVQNLAKEEGRLVYLKMPHKGGCPAPTKNEGVRAAKGKYVAFCDHDDWWAVDKLEKQVAYLEEHPEVGMLGCNVEIVDTEKNISLGTFWQNPYDFYLNDIRKLALDGPIYATTTCLMLRRGYALEHPFDEQFLGSDEYDISLHAALDNPKRVGMLSDVLAFWRWHSGSLSHSDQAATRALRDEKAFAAKLLARKDLSPQEKQQVRNRIKMVTRRAGNAELASGNIKEAKKYYKESQDKFSRCMLVALNFCPLCARQLVKWKRSYSHARPIFR